MAQDNLSHLFTTKGLDGLPEIGLSSPTFPDLLFTVRFFLSVSSGRWLKCLSHTPQPTRLGTDEERLKSFATTMRDEIDRNGDMVIDKEEFVMGYCIWKVQGEGEKGRGREEEKGEG